MSAYCKNDVICKESNKTTSLNSKVPNKHHFYSRTPTFAFVLNQSFKKLLFKGAQRKLISMWSYSKNIYTPIFKGCKIPINGRNCCNRKPIMSYSPLIFTTSRRRSTRPKVDQNPPSTHGKWSDRRGEAFLKQRQRFVSPPGDTQIEWSLHCA